MSSAEARIYLHGTGLRWLDTDPAGEEQELVFASQLQPLSAQAIDELESTLEQVLASLQARDVRVLLAANLAQWFSLPWSGALVGPDGAQAQCRFRLLDLWGDQRAASALCEVASHGYGKPAAAVCLDRDLFACLNRVLVRHGKRLRGLRALAVDTWYVVQRQVADSCYGYAVIEEGVVSLFVCDGGRLRYVAGQSWHEDWAEVVSLLWHRSQVRGLKPMPLHVLSLISEGSMQRELPGKRLHWPDAYAQLALPAIGANEWPEFAPVSRNDKIRFGALAVGVLLSLISGWSLWQAHAELAKAQVALARAEPRLIRKSVLNESEQKRLQQKVEAVNRLILQLNLPYPALMSALAPASDQIALRDIQLRQSADGARVKLMVSSSDAAAMTGYYAQLLRHPRLDRVLLLKHEIAKTTAPQFDFELEAVWH
ncbi:hypothetical protein [Chitinolyticbacter albus]|uniref:hypothetical protein n=1 Tax=Chitinolyticbacter albus TaxID=2961951 RepID=UPI00210EF56D|nr:hypothetical protein [Chitinolyticbacter albus]